MPTEQSLVLISISLKYHSRTVLKPGEGPRAPAFALRPSRVVALLIYVAEIYLNNFFPYSSFILSFCDTLNLHDYHLFSHTQ